LAKLLSVALGLAMLCSMSGARAADAPDVLSMNETYRQLYAQEKKDIIAKLGPVIVLTGDKVILLEGSKRRESAFTPATFTLYKAVDHIPLMIFLYLRDKTDKPLSVGQIEDLKAFIPIIGKSGQSLSGYHLPPDTVLRQKQLMDSSIAFINKSASAGTVNSEDLRRFTAGLRKPLFANIDAAVEDELTALNNQVQDWRKEMTPQQWQNLRVVIAGSHMPREHSHFMQYFSALLKEKQEGHRIIYMEGVATEQGALDLLATHLLDESIGVAFFGDEWRMHSDLLCDGGKHFLSKHPVR
jgi:hypothetical protein